MIDNVYTVVGLGHGTSKEQIKNTLLFTLLLKMIMSMV